jgi:hypothetical protein
MMNILPASGQALKGANGMEWIVVASEVGAKGVMGSVQLIARKYADVGELHRGFRLAAGEFRIFCAFLGVKEAPPEARSPLSTAVALARRPQAGAFDRWLDAVRMRAWALRDVPGPFRRPRR